MIEVAVVIVAEVVEVVVVVADPSIPVSTHWLAGLQDMRQKSIKLGRTLSAREARTCV